MDRNRFPINLCENFLYGFKAAPRGRSRRRLGRLVVAPAYGSRSSRSRPGGWREEIGKGRLCPGEVTEPRRFDTGTPCGGSHRANRGELGSTPDRGQAYEPPPPCKIAAPSSRNCR